MQNGMLHEMVSLACGLEPKDITGSAQNSIYINLKKGQRCRFILFGGAWAGGTPAVTLTQATDNAGTGAKALSFNTVWYGTKTSDVLTKQTVTSDTFNMTATANKFYIIDIAATDLDINNDFAYVRVNVATPGANADLLAVIAEVYQLHLEAAGPSLTSVL